MHCVYTVQMHIMSVTTYTYIHTYSHVYVKITGVILGHVMLFWKYWFDPEMAYPCKGKRWLCGSWRKHSDEYTYGSYIRNGRKVENTLGW